MLDFHTNSLTFSYSDQQIPLFEDLDLNFEPHSLNLITGDNGCGKSTLLKLLSGLKKAPQGSVLLNNQDICDILPSARVKYVSYLPQDPQHFFTFKTGIEQVRFALANLQLSPAEIEYRINKCIQTYSLNDLIDRPVNELSGGELQRLAFAIITTFDAEYYLLDEPFANLDQNNRVELLNELIKLKKDHTIIITDHDQHGYGINVDHLYTFKNQQLVHQAKPKLPSKYPVPRVTKDIDDLKDESFFKFFNLGLKIEKRNLLTDCNLNIPKGKIGLLCGKNGSGKSTLFAACTKQRKYNGSIKFKELEAAKCSAKKWLKHVNIGFQESENQFVKTTVKEEFNSALKITNHPQYWNNAQLNYWIKRFKLTSILDESPYFISGGQQKKVQLLILAIISAPVILFDEIFAGMDDKSIRIADKLLQHLTTLGCSILIIDHQLSHLSQYDYVLQLEKQKLFLLSKGDLINA